MWTSTPVNDGPGTVNVTVAELPPIELPAVELAAVDSPSADPEAADPEVLRWSTIWEDDLDGAQHEQLAGLLRRCFPRSRAGFAGASSWASARPELRIVAHETPGDTTGDVGGAGHRLVAHLAVLRRFLQVGERSLLVGDVGLVAVDPDRQGRGLGAELLDRAAAAMHALDLPFGFLTCGEQVTGFYAAAGWVRVDNPVRMIRADRRVQIYGGCAMALPLRSGMDSWPVSGRVERNGYEV